MKIKVILFVLLFVVAYICGFPFQEEKTLNLGAAGITGLEIDCGAGALKVTGSGGSDTIEVRAKIVLKGIDDDDINSFIKDNVTLTLEKKGDHAVLVSNIDSSFTSLFKRREAYIDLDVRVPAKLELSIDDGSGSIEVSGISGDVEIEDGSGSMEVSDIGGDLEIDDGSGSVIVRDVGGNVEIEDGSGEIKLENIKGNVDVDDNSGSVKIYGIGGSVVVDDGSGGIYIDGVEKDVFIKNAGSGALKINNVKGKVTK